MISLHFVSPRLVFRLIGALCIATSAARAATLFQFGPSDVYTDRQEAFLGEDEKKMTWGEKRLFSDTVPLTPRHLSPAVYGGYELYNASGSTIFTDYQGAPTTGVNDKTFAGRTLDSLGVEVGFTESKQPQNVSFAAAFLVLGRLERPAHAAGDLTISTRLNYRMIGEVPGSLRAVIRAGGLFYVSDHEVLLYATKDSSFVIPGSALRSATWRRYDPRQTVAFDGEVAAVIPSGDIDFAGVLVTRVVNEVGITYADFSTVEIAELVVESARR